MTEHPLSLAVPQALPPVLSGCAGTNRAPANVARQIAANDDVAAIGLWLAEYHDSPHTFRSYRKEAERLLLWATQIRGKPVSSLTREDVIAYEAFLCHPPATWCDDSLARRGEHRRLFTGPLAERSRRQALGILAGLFNYLVRAGYLAGSPFVLQRRRARRGMPRAIERYLDRSLWDDVLHSIDGWPRSTNRNCQRYERARWVLRFLYETALRASEAAAACESDFQRVRGRWWLHVVGKGDVEGQIPLSDHLMEDFARYRGFHGLPPAPADNGKIPAILGIAGRASALTPTAIYQIVKATFRHVADTLQKEDAAKASRVRRASTHWLRHTAATHQAEDGTPIHHIQQNLRHSSIGTTSIYLHAEEDSRHASTTRTRADASQQREGDLP
ncbi:MAG: site-specific integrase [Castellaniella sp.]|uniref:Site-specific recombinase XerD n=1 Tax=Rhodanobacter denitrificans TaxID=666685 RepID=M4NGI4_9GAMM|nr:MULTISPECIES: site-specific integrase [Pseudomonadota]AGG89207.1 site-specific recombinase XerD [Rhodanobacter denitrificans]TAN24943.1 MAG: site-specific integrase [Castellaniella sp.]UJJ60536.1 tyrosine-type recombinase/integrase [Rhodanobacter denitrificans]